MKAVLQALKTIIIFTVVIAGVAFFSFVDFNQKVIEHPGYTEKLVYLTSFPQTLKAGQEYKFSARLPVFGADTQLCFAIGKPIDSKNPDKAMQDKVRATLYDIMNMVEGEPVPSHPEKVFEGKILNYEGKQTFMLASALHGSNIPVDKEGTVLQVGACAELGYGVNESTQNVVMVTFKLFEDLPVEYVYWRTTNYLERAAPQPH